MTTTQDQDYLARSAANFRSLLNDLKRDEATAARELEVDVDTINKILSAQDLISADLIERAARVWPVNERDFHVLHDDTADGVCVMRAEQSRQTSRILTRGGVDYYEYRDTAMSRVSSIRPEWIRILNMVEDSSPLNPTVKWNNGHFLYQFTYFVGPVNYYYSWNGKKYCAEMNTGDSVFGLPYAPHSFATRSPSEPGLILALTFGGYLASGAQHELGVLPNGVASKLAVPFENTDGLISPQRLAVVMNERSYGVAELAANCNIAEATVKAILDGSHTPDFAECTLIGAALRVPVRELCGPRNDTANGIRLVRGAQAKEWSYPAGDAPFYRIRELASSTAAPFAGGYEVFPLRTSGPADEGMLELGAHCYGYVVGTSPLRFVWSTGEGIRETELNPGDSIYIKPHVRHCFLSLAEPGEETSSILTLRVGGKLSGDAACEASVIGAAAIERLRRDTMRWYDG